MAERTKPSSARRWIVLAIMAVAITGAIALYASSRETGKFATMIGSNNSCAAKVDDAQRVGQAARGAVAAMLPADPPKPVSDLKFFGPKGESLSIAAFTGKTVILNLWAIWCPPCRAEMPALDRLQQSLAGEAFEVVTVNIDTGDQNAPRDFLNEIGVTHLSFYRDPTIGIFNELKARGIALGLPVTMLIDPQGCLLGYMNGPAEWDSKDARHLIEAVAQPRPKT